MSQFHSDFSVPKEYEESGYEPRAIETIIVGKKKIDEDTLDELESILIQSDVGVATTLKIINSLEGRIARDKYLGFDDLVKDMVDNELIKLMKLNER